MEVPEYLYQDLENFLQGLQTLLKKAKCSLPVENDSLIKKFSDDPDLCSLQHCYSLAWIILNKILPILAEPYSLTQTPKLAAAVVSYALISHSDEFKISGKWSYYAACDFVKTMEELAKKFKQEPADSPNQEIIKLLQDKKTDPQTLINKIVSKLWENSAAERDYQNLKLKLDGPKQSLNILKSELEEEKEEEKETSKFLLKSQTPQDFLAANDVDTQSIITELNKQSKKLVDIQKNTTKIQKELYDLVEPINELPEKMLLTSTISNDEFKKAPDLEEDPSSISAEFEEVSNSKFYEFEIAPRLEPVFDQLASLTTLLETKRAAIETSLNVIDNQRYFKQIYDDITRQLIDPLKEKLSNLADSHLYSSDQYNELVNDLSALDKIDFFVATRSMKFPQYAKQSEHIQQAFNQSLTAALDPLKEQLNTRIKQQIQLFNQELIQTLARQQEKFEIECKDKLKTLSLKAEMIETYKDDEENLDALQNFYDEYDSWLKKQLNLKERVTQWVIGKNLANDRGTQKLVDNFYSTVDYYKNLDVSIKDLAKPLNEAIQSGQVNLQMANSEKTKELSKKAENEQHLITEYEQKFNQIDNQTKKLTEQYTINYQKETEKRLEINEKITELLKKRTELIDRLKIDIDKIPDDIPVIQLKGILTDQKIYAPVEKFLQELQEEETQSNKILIDLKNNIDKTEQKGTELNTLKGKIAKAFFKSHDFHTLIEELSVPNPSSNDLLTPKHRQDIITLLRNQSRFYSYLSNFLFDTPDQKQCEHILDSCISENKKLSNQLNESKTQLENNIKDNLSVEKCTEIYDQLKELDTQLRALIDQYQTAEKSLDNLNQTQPINIRNAYIPINEYLPEGIDMPPQGQEHQVHQKNLYSKKCHLKLLKAQLELFAIKKALFEQKPVLNNHYNNLAKLKIEPFTFQYNPPKDDSFDNPWQAHAAQIKAIINTTEKSIGDTTATLDEIKKIASDLLNQLNIIKESLCKTEENLRNFELAPETFGLTPLIHLRETLAQEVEDLSKKIVVQEKLIAQKNTELSDQKNLHQKEQQEKNRYQQLLTQATDIQKQLEVDQKLLTEHNYPNTVINDLIEGKMPENFIIEEDNFYSNFDQKYFDLNKKLTELNQMLSGQIDSDLCQAFKEVLRPKLAVCQQLLNELSNTKKHHQERWETLSNQNAVIINSRQVILQASQDIYHYYANYDLRGIKLSGRNFQNSTVQGINFEYAQLNSCDFSYRTLKGTNFKHANVKTCNFEHADFQGVILDEHTDIEWEKYGYAILRDNLVNPYTNVDQKQRAYLSHLIELVRRKCDINDTADKQFSNWILDILKEIGAAPPRTKRNHDEKMDLSEQQQRAVFFMQQIIPNISVDTLLGLHDLIATKHAEEHNPYGFIRRELDFARCTYGNTQPWEQIITLIKARLQQWADSPTRNLSKQEYQYALKIMSTQTQHTYFFGKLAFFFTPAATFKQNWENQKDKLIEGPSPETKSHLNK